MGIFRASTFADNELTNKDKWNLRVWKPISDALTSRLGDQNWIAPTLGASWVNFGSGYAVAGYRVRDGVLQIRGMIKSGTSGATIFTLPVGYRPDTDLMFICAAAGGVARLDVRATGVVLLSAYSAAGSNAFVSLNVATPI